MEIEAIQEVTGCLVPCSYKQYKTVGQPTPSSEPSNYTFVGIWSISNSTFMEEEALIYPWTSLVAEFGGTLGLFLGVSAMTLWDGMEWLVVALKTNKNKVCCAKKGKA